MYVYVYEEEVAHFMEERANRWRQLPFYAASPALHLSAPATHMNFASKVSWSCSTVGYDCCTLSVGLGYLQQIRWATPPAGLATMARERQSQGIDMLCSEFVYAGFLFFAALRSA